jgi:MFS family permease
VFGAVLIGAMAPLGWLLTRDRPEDHDLQPDGAATDDEDTGDEPLEVNWTLSQAKRCSAFWITCAGMASMSMLNTGLYFHIFSVFGDVGLSSTTAAKVFVPIATTSAAMQLITGWLVGRIRLRFLLAASLFLEAVILVFVTRLSSVPEAYALGIGMGIQSGIEMLVMSVIFANYYGRRHLGAIAGFSSQLLVAASALGPMPFGVARDVLGSYGAVLTTMAVLPLALGVACLLFGEPPARPPEDGNPAAAHPL